MPFSLNFIIGLVFFVMSKVEYADKQYYYSIFYGSIALVFFAVDFYNQLARRNNETKE